MDRQDILYRQAMENEKQMRANMDNRKNYELADKLRKDLYDELGVESNCLSDLTYRKIADDQCISILTRYIPLFQNVGIRLDLIKQQFCRKNNTECSNFLEKWYYDLKRENALNKAIENTLDNAFAKIQDKRKIAFYLQLIEKADQFPLVMTMLGKWNIENAKPIIINRLEIDRIKTNAIRALGYYKDKSTVPLIEKYVDSEYSGVRKEAKKVLSILL